tara:strand:+ start:47 stop:613 length:567 start_codon:yes stop_codon:yes gene_type:complete
MKKFFYYFFFIFFFVSNILANELDEEFIDKKYNEIKTEDFCSITEWNTDQKRFFVLAFILGWHWEVKEEKLDKYNDKDFEKFFSQICNEKGSLINNLENLIIKNNFKIFNYTGHDWIKLDSKNKKVFIKGYNAGVFSNNDKKERMIVKYNVLFARLSDWYHYTNHRDETVGLTIKTIVDQMYGHLYLE